MSGRRSPSKFRFGPWTNNTVVPGATLDSDSIGSPAFATFPALRPKVSPPPTFTANRAATPRGDRKRRATILARLLLGPAVCSAAESPVQRLEFPGAGPSDRTTGSAMPGMDASRASVSAASSKPKSRSATS